MLNNLKRNFFITLEGIEGVGKSTGLEFLHQYLLSHNIPVTMTREPGGTPIAEAIRQLLLTHHEETMHADTELLLMFAGRAQHIASVIKPALHARHWVLCDRFTDASYAYQGGGRGISVERINMLENWVQRQLRPDRVLLLDAPVELALLRTKKRKLMDRFESEQEQFFLKVRETYLARAKLDPERYRIVDASLSQADVQKQLVNYINELILID